MVGADVVEVSPAYDHADITSTAASQIVYELITNMVKKGPVDPAIVEANKRSVIGHDNELHAFEQAGFEAVE